MNTVKLKRDHPLNDPQVRVMLALRFTAEDLQANREGYLTKQQRSRLNRDRAAWTIGFLVALVAVPVGLMWALADGIRIYGAVAIALVGLIASGVSAYFWFKKRSFDRDLQKGDVAAAQGTLQLGKRILRSRGSPPYFLSLDGLGWYVDGYVAFGLANNEPYAIYFAPHSKKILSAEWLGRRDISE